MIPHDLVLSSFNSLNCTKPCRSTLLRAIGEGLVVGFPSNLHALYVDQLASTSADCSVLELVMDADKDVLHLEATSRPLAGMS